LIKIKNYRRISLCTEQSSITTCGKFTPGPRREPGTFCVARKGPDHYPSWEIVAWTATECGYSEVCVGKIWRISSTWLPPATARRVPEFYTGGGEREGCVDMTNACITSGSPLVACSNHIFQLTMYSINNPGFSHSTPRIP
jgi:hypothetical protein